MHQWEQWNLSQRPRIDLNKKFLPKDQILLHHESLYPIGVLSARIKILHIGNFFTKQNEFECNFYKDIFCITKNQFLNNLCSGTQCGGFQFLLILDLYGISFHAVVVFGLGKNLFFKLVPGHSVITGHVIYNSSYTYKLQLKTT